MDKLIMVSEHLKEMDSSDLDWLLGNSQEPEFLQEVMTELILRDIRLEQCTPEVN